MSAGAWRPLRAGLLRLFVSVFLLSVNVALVHALAHLPLGPRPLPLGYALGGLAAGLVLFGLFVRGQRAYVLGHEATHWLLAKLWGRPTADFRAGAESGSVRVARPNLWIVLGPYIVPIYTLVWLAVYALLFRFWPAAAPPAVLELGLGLTFAFHLVRTVAALRAGQPDLRYYGTGLSLLLIAAVNLALFYGAVAVLAGDPAAAVRALAAGWAAQFRALAWLVATVRG